jgi:hypothetical protein
MTPVEKRLGGVMSFFTGFLNSSHLFMAGEKTYYNSQKIATLQTLLARFVKRTLHMHANVGHCDQLLGIPIWDFFQITSNQGLH